MKKKEHNVKHIPGTIWYHVAGDDPLAPGIHVQRPSLYVEQCISASDVIFMRTNHGTLSDSFTTADTF